MYRVTEWFSEAIGGYTLYYRMSMLGKPCTVGKRSYAGMWASQRGHTRVSKEVY